ncbi:MAG: O-antigen ligase family protein [Pirellulales bacterium]|nr:O-antigen ligase family protein [Pirellulales bacterium]
MHTSGLQLESDARPAAAGVAWPLLLWMLVATSLASFRQRSGDELFDAGGIDWQVKFQILCWTALGALCCWFVVSGRADLRLLRRGPLFWYTGFALWAMVSALWSPAPALTAFRGFQHLVAVGLAISLGVNLHRIYLFIGVFLLVNWVLVVMGLLGLDLGQAWIRDPVHPDTYYEGPWRFASAYGHPSWISIVAAVGAVGLAARTRGRQWLWAGPVVAWFVVTNLATMSRTAIAGMVGGFVVAAFGRRSLLPLVCLVGFVSAAVLLPDPTRDAMGWFVRRGQSSEDFKSLTGRKALYREALRRAEQAWPLGTGFQSGRVNPLDETGSLVSMGHAHNLVLESLSGLGLPGMLLALMVVASTVANLGLLLWMYPERGTVDPAPSWELAAMLVPLFAFCVLDSGFASRVDSTTLLFVAVLARLQTTIGDAHLPGVTTAAKPQALERMSDHLPQRQSDRLGLSS